MTPRNPLEIVEFAQLVETNGTMFSNPGTFLLSSRYVQSAENWQEPTFAVSANPQCVANGQDVKERLAEAAQWNLSHETGGLGYDLPPQLKRIFVLRSGSLWTTRFQLTFPHTEYRYVQLTCKQNLLTEGDAQGRIPVLQLVGDGQVNTASSFEVCVRGAGMHEMALCVNNHADGKVEMYDMTWLVTP